MCVAQVFYQTTTTHGWASTARASWKIFTRNQLVCSFSTLSPLLFRPRCLLRMKRARAYITWTEIPNTFLTLQYIHVQQGVNRCIIHGMYIHNIIFTKRRWRRDAFKRAVRKNCASSALWFSDDTRGSGLL